MEEYVVLIGWEISTQVVLACWWRETGLFRRELNANLAVHDQANDCDIPGHTGLVGEGVIQVAVFWNFILCEVIGGYKRFGGSCYLALQG
jgi:hypothetical protein